MSLVAERGSAVRLSFGAGQVTIEAETQGRARARETVRADFEGPEPVIAFSPHFLLDGITAAGVPAGAPHPDSPHPDSPHPDSPHPDSPHPESPSPAARSGESGPLGPEPAAAAQAGIFIRLEFTAPPGRR